MTFVSIALGQARAADVAQAPAVAQNEAVQRKAMEAQLRVGDALQRFNELRIKRSITDAAELPKLEASIAEAQKQYIDATIALQGAEAQLRATGKVENVEMVPPPEPVMANFGMPAEPIFGRNQLELAGAGFFLLMIPIVFALARRIWVRSGPRQQPALDLESSPRLRRLEDAMESIAIEIERIGESQRFVTKVLTERGLSQPDASALPAARKAPGTITPH